MCGTLCNEQIITKYYNGICYNIIHDSVVSRPRNRRRVRRREYFGCKKDMSREYLGRCPAKARPDQSGSEPARSLSPSWQQVGAFIGQPERTTQHADQRSVPNLFHMGEWKCL